MWTEKADISLYWINGAGMCGAAFQTAVIQMNSQSGRNKAELQSALLLKYYDTEQGNLSSINSYASSVRKGGVAVSSIADGCRIVFTFMEEQLTVVVEVTLTNKGVSINVPMERIAEEGDNLLMDLTLYPFFGAADAAAEGYMLVPDGAAP